MKKLHNKRKYLKLLIKMRKIYKVYRVNHELFFRFLLVWQEKKWVDVEIMIQKMK